MSGTIHEESLHINSEKEPSQSDAAPGIEDSLGVEHFDVHTQSNNKENLINNKVTEAVSNEDFCLEDQLDNSSCRFKNSEETDIPNKQDVDTIASDVEPERSQGAEEIEIFIPPEEFCDTHQDEADLTFANFMNVTQHDNVQIDQFQEINHLKNLEVESCSVEVVPTENESSNLLNYSTEVVTCKEISHDKHMQESDSKINEEKVTYQSLVEGNLIDLENPVSDFKDFSNNNVIQVTKKTEVPQCDINNISENNEETTKSLILFEKISLNTAQLDLMSGKDNKLAVCKQDGIFSNIDKEEKSEEINISKTGDRNLLIPIEDDLKENTDNGEVSNSSTSIKLQKLTSEYDPLLISGDQSEISVQNQLNSIKENYLNDQVFNQVNDSSVVDKDNLNNETLESINKFNAKEALSIEVKDIDMATVRDSQETQLNTDQEQSIVSSKIEVPQIEKDNVDSLLKVETNEKESLQDETGFECSEISEAASLEEVREPLEVEKNLSKNQPLVTKESLLEIKDKMPVNIGKDISVLNCRSVDDNLVDTVETVLQENEKKEFQETTNLMTSDNDSKEKKESIEIESEKITEGIVTCIVDSVNNSTVIDNSNKIEDKEFVEDKKPIAKDEASLKIDQKDIYFQKNDVKTVRDYCSTLESKNLPGIGKQTEVLIDTLQGMRWLKTGQNNEVNQIQKQLKSLPRKNERSNDNFFEGTKKNNKRKKFGNNKNDKTNAASQLKAMEATNQQKSQASQQQKSTDQIKNEKCSVWDSNTAKKLFSKPSAEAVVIDVVKEEEEFNTALVESICTAQQESERRKMLETSLKRNILKEPDDDQWGKIQRNLPQDVKDVNLSTAKGVVDKYGRVDGCSEKHLFMGKGARRKEQEFLKSQTENKSQMGSSQTKPPENKSQVIPPQTKPLENKNQSRPTQTKPFEGNVAQMKQNSQFQVANKSQNAELPKKEVEQADKNQERPIHGRAGKEGPPGQIEMQKPGFNRSSNKDFNIKQGQNVPPSENVAGNIGQTHGKNQESNNKSQQAFGQQRYGYKDCSNRGNEKVNIEQSYSSGYQSDKNQSQNQDRLKLNQVYPYRNQGNIGQNQTTPGQAHNQGYSGRNQGSTFQCQPSLGQAQNQASSDKTQSNLVQKQPYTTQCRNQSYSDKATSNSNQANSGQKQVNFTQDQKYSDKSEVSQTNRYNSNTLRTQEDYRSQENNRYQSNYRNYHDDPREQGNSRYDNWDNHRCSSSYKQEENQNYSDRNRGNQNNSDRNYSGKDNYQHQYLDRNTNSGKDNYQNQYSDRNTKSGKDNYQNQYSDRNSNNAFKSQDNHRGNQNQENQLKNWNSYGKNQSYSNQQQENKSKVQMEENWDDDQSKFKSNQQVNNPRAIRSQDLKASHQSSLLENQKVSMDKEIVTPTSICKNLSDSSQLPLSLNSIAKSVETQSELINVKKIDVEQKPNILMDFDGNANIQRALGLDPSTYNQQTAPASSTSVSTTLSQILTPGVAQNLSLTQSTSQPATNYNAVVVCPGAMMNVDAPPFTSSNYPAIAAAPFSTDLVSFGGLPFEASETPSPSTLRMIEEANSSEEYLQAHAAVSSLKKQLAAAEAKLFALNVRFFHEGNSGSACAQDSANISNVGTIGDVQQPQQSRAHSVPAVVSDFVAMQQSLPQGFQVPANGMQNVVAPIAFDATRNFAAVNVQEMSTEAYQLTAAFQQRLNLQPVYLPQGGMYQPHAVANFQQYSSNLNAANRLHRVGRGTPANSEQKDLRVGGLQFYNQ